MKISKKISLIVLLLVLVVGVMIIKDDKPSKTQECLEDAFNENNYGVKIIDENGDDVTKSFILENKELYAKDDWDAIMDNYAKNDYYLSVANPPIED